jgi:hypothetical protein
LVLVLPVVRFGTVLLVLRITPSVTSATVLRVRTLLIVVGMVPMEAVVSGEATVSNIRVLPWLPKKPVVTVGILGRRVEVSTRLRAVTAGPIVTGESPTVQRFDCAGDAGNDDST